MSNKPAYYSIPQTADGFFSELARKAAQDMLYHTSPQFWQAFANTVKFDEIKPWLDTLQLGDRLKTKTDRAVLIAHLYLRAQGIAKERPSSRMITAQVNNVLGSTDLTDANTNRYLDHLGIRNRHSKPVPGVRRRVRPDTIEKRFRARYSVLKIEPQLAAVAMLAEKGLSAEQVVDCLNFVKTEIGDKAPQYEPDMLTQERRTPLVGEQLLRRAFRRGQQAALTPNR